MEPLTMGFSAVLLMGLVFGAGPCNVSCLPYLGPVFLGSERPWRLVVPFSLGRMVGYAALAATAGALGRVATGWLDEGPAAWLLGGATGALGLMILVRAGRRLASACGTVAPRSEVGVDFPGPAKRPLGPGVFALGIGMALNPCVPLGTVLLAAAASGSAFSGLSLGVGFGLGAVAIPAIVFGLLVARIGSQVREHLMRWRRTLEQGAGTLLIVLGTMTGLGWVQP